MTTTRKMIGAAFALTFPGAIALTGCSMSAPTDEGTAKSQTDMSTDAPKAEGPRPIRLRTLSGQVALHTPRPYRPVAAQSKECLKTPWPSLHQTIRYSQRSLLP